MSGRRSISLLAAVVVLLAAAVSAFGQGAALGSISGRVTDPSQAPVPDAGITVADTRTGLVYAAATMADGYYPAFWRFNGRRP